MTPSQQAKAAGMKSLAEVTRMTGQSKETLRNWSINKPQLFSIVIAGCVAEKEKRENSAHHNLEKANESN